jgi:hypothetical protein
MAVMSRNGCAWQMAGRHRKGGSCANSGVLACGIQQSCGRELFFFFLVQPSVSHTPLPFDLSVLGFMLHTLKTSKMKNRKKRKKQKGRV